MNFQQKFIDSLKTSTTLTKSLSLMEYLPESIEVTQDIEDNLPHIQAYKNISCVYPYYYASSNLYSYCIILTESGAGTLNINQEDSSLLSHSLAIVNCLDLHRLEIKQSTWNYKVLFLNGSPVPFLFKTITKNRQVLNLPLYSSIPMRITKIFKLLDNNKCNTFYISKLVLDLLFEIMLENNNLSESQNPIPTYLLEIKNDFNVNCNKKFTLDSLEQEYRISRYRICREFSKYFNESPIQYLNNIRMKEAKDLLIQTDKRINEIGQLIGFENTNHFIRLFRQKTGVTPLEYRKQSPVTH